MLRVAPVAIIVAIGQLCLKKIQTKEDTFFLEIITFCRRV